jgi:2-polyprenyl-6-hydroxyphenyl methylase/3-demethylubiquinone-9 3-methyltransferase
MRNELRVWGMESVPREIFSKKELDYLEPLIERQLPSVDWVWAEMDKVWDAVGLDNCAPLKGQNVGLFYSHPVWIMNAFFTGADPVSAKHRHSIAKFASELGVRRIADYGGGGGELARKISELCPSATIDIVEPFPSALGKQRISGLENVRIVGKLTGEYDLIIAQDVLEHVDQPIAVAEEIAGALKVGGTAIFANCFYPVIKCHLPRTFHLRYTFKFVVGLGGLKYKGSVQGALHAQIFQKKDSQRSFGSSVLVAEKLSFIGGGRLLNFAANVLHKLKRL